MTENFLRMAGILTHIVGERSDPRMTHTIDIHSEVQGPAGWSFAVEVDSGSCHSTSQLKLSFADYNLWCASGSCAPADVARAVVTFMLKHGESLPATLDASLARRKFRHADEEIPTLIRG